MPGHGPVLCIGLDVHNDSIAVSLAPSDSAEVRRYGILGGQHDDVLRLLKKLGAAHPPLAVWRYYNGRADCENVIKELRAGFALPTLCLEQFWASEAALSLASLTYNLIVLFERHLGWQEKVTLRNLRFWLFVTAGVLSHPAGQTTIKLAVPGRERDRWRRLWERILSPIPNCNAVENHPVFTSQFA